MGAIHGTLPDLKIHKAGTWRNNEKCTGEGMK